MGGTHAIPALYQAETGLEVIGTGGVPRAGATGPRVGQSPLRAVGGEPLGQPSGETYHGRRTVRGIE